jgi:hypothetical protein
MQTDARYRSTGTLVGLECDDDRNLYVTIANNGLMDAALGGRLYAAANQAAVATTAALAGTWTGLCISNPTGNSKNFVMHEFSWGMSVVGSDDGAVGLITCTIAAPASVITSINQYRGGAASTAYVDDGATIVGGALIRPCGDYGTGATNLIVSTGPHVIDLKGGIVLTPGYTLATYTTTATTAAFVFGFVWEEVDV